ncbi:MAG: hypothetical protein L7U87_08960 [Chlamydiales bacterium]|nr:hypothetical protein [Chlamydiales bacterium]
MCWNEIGRPSSISYKEDCRIARTYLKKCSDDNNEEADLILATAYFEGKLGTDKNLPLAKYHAEKAVNTRFLDEDTKRPIKELLKEINSQLEKEEKTFLPPPQPDVIQQNRAQVIAPERLQQLERAAEAIEEIIEQERGTIALITLFIQAYRFTNSKLEYYLTRTRFF